MGGPRGAMPGAPSRDARSDEQVGPQQHGDQRPQLVERVGGELAEQIATGAQQRAEGESQHREGQFAQRQVEQQHADRVLAVEAVQMRGGLARGSPSYGDCPALLRCRLSMVDDRIGHAHDTVAGQCRPPAEVDVVAQQRQRRVEAAELFPDIAAHEHPRGVDRQHLAHAVVLTLVLLPAFQQRLAPAAARDRDTHLEQQPLVVPTAHLRTGCSDGRVSGNLGQQDFEGAWIGLGVVVQQPDPLAFAGDGAGREIVDVASTRSANIRAANIRAPDVRDQLGHRWLRPASSDLRQAQQHGSTKASARAGFDDVFRAQRIRDQGAGLVGAAGVDGHNIVGLAGLRGERRERARQPGSAVVRHENRRHASGGRGQSARVDGSGQGGVSRHQGWGPCRLSQQIMGARSRVRPRRVRNPPYAASRAAPARAPPS